MAETIEELTVNWTNDDGILTTKELDKHVLTKGAWTTIIFRYCDMDRKTGDYGPPKAVIRRYQKRGGIYRMQSKFVFSSANQARKVMEVLGDWFPPETEE